MARLPERGSADMQKSFFTWYRALGSGLVFGAMGFVFAVSTSVSGSRGLDGDFNTRAIGSQCQRRSTTFVTASDLGVVVVGTQFTRQIIVQFGFKPHKFSFGRVLPKTGITISESGTITGKEATAGIDIFEVIAEDDFGGDIVPFVAQTFVLTAVPLQTSPLQNTQIINGSTLPTAVAGEPYSFTFHGNGGRPPYSFGFLEGSSFTALPKGLALNPTTGLLFGKPSVPTGGTPATFTIFVVDDTRILTPKAFSLNILPGTISSDFVATGGTLNLNFGKEGGTDSLKLSMIVNKSDLATAGVRDAADLNNQTLALDIGGVQIPARTSTAVPIKFNKSGSIIFPGLPTGAGGVLPKKTDPRYEISLNPKTGQLKINLTNVDLIKGLGANFSTFADPIIPIGIKIGKPADDAFAAASATPPVATATTTSPVNFDRTDVVKFIYKRKDNIGKGAASKNTKLAPAGMFLVTKVQGKISRSSDTKDNLSLKMSGFLRAPNGAAITPKSGDSVQVLLGMKCLGELPASSLSSKGDVLTFTNADPVAGLRTLVIDNKRGTFTIDTFPFDPLNVFDQDILEAGVPFSVPLTLTIAPPLTGGAAPSSTVATFDGQSSVTLFRKGDSLKNK